MTIAQPALAPCHWPSQSIGMAPSKKKGSLAKTMRSGADKQPVWQPHETR
ncbi:hypothetical protein PATSB16_29110 [Pandoraea thiooxydans]|nr:hypothetical protein PATSB16_29110 [Pandoraea thiooxydans]